MTLELRGNKSQKMPKGGSPLLQGESAADLNQKSQKHSNSMLEKRWVGEFLAIPS